MYALTFSRPTFAFHTTMCLQKTKNCAPKRTVEEVSDSCKSGSNDDVTPSQRKKSKSASPSEEKESKNVGDTNAAAVLPSPAETSSEQSAPSRKKSGGKTTRKSRNEQKAEEQETKSPKKPKLAPQPQISKTDLTKLKVLRSPFCTVCSNSALCAGWRAQSKTEGIPLFFKFAGFD